MYTKNSTLNGTINLQVGNDLVHNRSRNGKTIAAVATGLAIQHSVDTNQLTLLVHQSTTTVTSIDGSIGLDKALDTIGTEGTSLSTNDTCGYSTGQVKGVTNSQYPLSQLQIITITNGDGRKVLTVNLYQRQVGSWVTTNDTTLELAIVIQLHLYLISFAYHMIVGYNITVTADNYTTTCTMSVRSFVFTLLWLLTSTAKAEEIAKEVTERILNRHSLCLTCLRYLNIYNGIYR